MKKKQLKVFLGVILLVMAALLVAGLFFNKTEVEKLDGLTDIFDVNRNDTIAFVRHEAGKPEIYLKTDNKEERAVQLSTKENITDIAFSPNGVTLFYSVISRNENTSVIYALDIRSFDQKVIFKDDAQITEVTVDPNDENKIYYLKADTFDNYSPIASARPHDIDLFSYQIDTRQETQHTSLKTYAMASLQISADSKSAYVQMMDERKAKTAEEIFDMKQQIFQIPLDGLGEISSVAVDWAADIYSFAMLPDGESLIFQAVSNMAAKNETYQYELYYNEIGHKPERITDVKSHAGNPVISADGSTIYFIVNEGFATIQDEFYLYKMDIDGQGATEIKLNQP